MSRALSPAELWARRTSKLSQRTRAEQASTRLPVRSSRPRRARRARQSHHLHVAFEPPAPRRMTELSERLGFDLADSLARDVEGGTDLLQSPRTPVVREPEPQPDHFRFALAQGLEHLVHFVLQHRESGGLRG